MGHFDKKILPFSERDALAKFCIFLSECCSCKSGFVGDVCDVSLVALDGEALFPILLSKAREFGLEAEFFGHVTRFAEVKKLRQEIPAIKFSSLRDSSFQPLSSVCKLMRETVAEKVKRLDAVSTSVSGLKVDPGKLRSSRDALDGIYVGDSVQVDLEQASRPNCFTNFCVAFGTDADPGVGTINDTWEKKKGASSQVVFLKNVGNWSLAEIIPEPNGRWTFTKYSVSNGLEVVNGTTHVFDGRFVVLSRRKGYDFPGQVLGVCQFVRPSVGKLQCPGLCSKEFNVSAIKPVSLRPGSLTAFEGKVEADAANENCLASGHVLRVTRVSVSGLVVVDGFAEADVSAGKLSLVIKNSSNSLVTVSEGEGLLTVSCCFTDSELKNLLSRSSTASASLLPFWPHRKLRSSCQNGTDASGVGNGIDDSDVICISSSDEESLAAVGDDDDDGEIEIIDSRPPNDPSLSRIVSVEWSGCLFCDDRGRNEKCPICPEFEVRLTEFHDSFGIRVAR